jgi:hypothetical protein
LGIAFLTAVFGLIGVVVGGFLQYYFSSSLETEKQRMQIQLAAYADFAKAQAAWQRAGAETDDSKERSNKRFFAQNPRCCLSDCSFQSA